MSEITEKMRIYHNGWIQGISSIIEYIECEMDMAEPIEKAVMDELRQNIISIFFFKDEEHDAIREDD